MPQDLAGSLPGETPTRRGRRPSKNLVHIARRSRSGGEIVWMLWWRDPATGRKRSRECQGWSQDEVVREQEALEARLGPTGPSLPWGEFVKRCMAAYAVRHRPSSTRVLQSVFRRYEATMTPNRLGDVTREAMQSYLAGQLGAGIAVVLPAGRGTPPRTRLLSAVRGATTNKHLGMLRGAFAWASMSGLLADEWPNPCRGIRRLKETHLSRCVYERREHVDLIVRAMAAGGTRWEVATLLAVECGLRVDEIAHLTWTSVDVVGREVLVHPEPDGWIPKGTTGRLEMTSWLAGAIGRLDRDGPRVVGGESPAGFVRRFRVRLKAACKATGLPEITPHGLRRTFGTILANSGMQAQQLQRVMRHADIQTTLRYYVRIDERKAAIEARRRIEEAP
jgi:integrase